jgi:molybdopterin converting factor small subunit
MTNIHLYSNLQRYSDNHSLVHAEGKKVGECINNLITQYPSLKSVLFNESGNLNPEVYISINLNSTHTEPLQRPLDPDDQVYIILIVSGG